MTNLYLKLPEIFLIFLVFFLIFMMFWTKNTTDIAKLAFYKHTIYFSQILNVSCWHCEMDIRSVFNIRQTVDECIPLNTQSMESLTKHRYVVLVYRNHSDWTTNVFVMGAIVTQIFNICLVLLFWNKYKML